jgi:Protein of unknown function (DUF3455)
MRTTLAHLASITVAVFGAFGCASIGNPTPPTVPSNLQPPNDEEPFMEAQASGVQIYECVPKSGQSGSYEWVFRAPEAALADRTGRSLGKHYAGPTWESTDGSRVLGESRARDPGPDANAIPWLLLGAKSTFGNGVMTKTRSIQRVATHGGTTPTEACGASNANQFARVPYTATYYFWRGR